MPSKPEAPASGAKGKKATKRLRWLDPKTDTPLIDNYARQMTSFVQALADGVIDDAEIKDQEKRLVALMKEVEPRLDDELHELVTRLLCEVTVYDMMQILSSVQQARPATRFRG